MPQILKHRWSVANNYLAGITLYRWIDLLRENSVSPAYWHRAVFITAAACLNSLARRKERRLDAAIRATPLAGPPLFILGHWRSGTTHLHNLLALDTLNFAFANTYQVTNPLTFLTTEETNTRRFAGLVPDKRPMDEMAMGFALPQEDEFAPCMDTLKSSYLGISFPRRQQHFDRYLTFDDVPADEINDWKDSLLTFCKKLTYKYQRPLLLKSPSHTARIRHLLEWFPDARFVHIHRHPHHVFRSTQHLYDTVDWLWTMQRRAPDADDATILRQYRALHDAWFEDRDRIPAGQLHELAFEDLVADPTAALTALYTALGLGAPPLHEPAPYVQNTYAPLSEAGRAAVRDAAGPCFDAWGYPR